MSLFKRAWVLPVFIGLSGCMSNVAVTDSGVEVTIRQVESAQMLKAEMDAKADGLTVVHALDAAHYQKGHVPGAINVDYEKMTPDALPEDMSAPIIFYCASSGCPVSHMAARKAVSYGHTNVAVYRGGIKGWQAAGMEVATGRP